MSPEVNKLIVTDYLEVSFDFQLPSIVKSFNICDCVIEMTNIKNNYFQYICNIYIHGDLVGELKYKPLNRFVGANTVHIKFENRLLYSKEFNYYLEYIRDVMNFKFNHILRLDIAIDTVKHNLLAFFRKFQNSKNIVLSGNHKKIHIEYIGKEYKTIHIGSSKSDKYIKIYNKSKELQTFYKEHIQEFYQLNGLDYIQNEVERIELTLRTKHLKNVDVQLLTDSNYLASVCRSHYKGLFEFYSNYVAHGKRSKKNVTPISLNEFRTTLLPVYKYSKSYSIKPQKMVIKKLFMEVQTVKKLIAANGENFESLNKISIYEKAINEYCSTYKLTDYYNSKQQLWLNEDKRK